MIVILAIVSTSIFFHNYLFSLVLGIFSSSLLASLKITILLFIFTTLYIRSLGLIYYSVSY